MKLFLLLTAVATLAFTPADANAMDEAIKLFGQFLQGGVTRDIGKLVDRTAKLSSICARHNFPADEEPPTSIDFFDFLIQMDSCRTDKLESTSYDPNVWDNFRLVGVLIDASVILSSTDLELLAGTLGPFHLLQNLWNLRIELAATPRLYRSYADCAADATPSSSNKIPALEFWEAVTYCFFDAVQANREGSAEKLGTTVTFHGFLTIDLSATWQKIKFMYDLL